jgi:hypothetical protein
MSRFVIEDDTTESRFVIEEPPKASKQKETQPGLRAQGAKLPTAFRGAMNAMQGPTFGFMDEIAGGVSAAADKFLPSALGGQRNPGMGFGDLYTRYRDVARGASDQYQKDNPIVAPLTQVAASLPLGGAYRAAEGALPAAAGVGGLIRNAAVVGAGSGALGGAGNAESFEEVPFGMLTGGALGGVTSGVLAGGGQAVRATSNNVRARFSERTADDLAKSRVATALQRDDKMIPQVSTRLARLGDEATIADSAGKNTRDLLDTMATMPGRTADRAETLIRQRQIGRPDRIIGGAAGLAGGRQLPEELAALTKQQSDNAGPIYNAIRNVPVAADSRLQRILQRPVLQDAVAQARVAAANADEVLPDFKAGDPVPMAVWDRIKRGLDDVIGLKKRGVDAGTANNAAKSTLADAVRTKRELLEVLDELVPDYKKARDAFSGPAALKDAMEEGRGLFATKPADLRALLGDMTASERDAFRVGAAQALQERVGTESGQTAILKFWKEPATRERLQAVFPDARTFRQFEARLLGEGRLKALEQVGRGSQTASRQSRMDDEGAAFLTEALGAGASLKAGNPVGILSGVRSLYGRTVMPEPVRDQIGSILMQRGPNAQATLGDLSRYVEAEQARRAAVAARSGLLGSAGGAGISSLLGN